LVRRFGNVKGGSRRKNIVVDLRWLYLLALVIPTKGPVRWSEIAPGLFVGLSTRSYCQLAAL
ncbi:MAG: hypothetical protein ACI8P2_004005, partial [Candidatus Latescibacterota bacterium]